MSHRDGPVERFDDISAADTLPLSTLGVMDAAIEEVADSGYPLMLCEPELIARSDSAPVQAWIVKAEHYVEFTRAAAYRRITQELRAAEEAGDDAKRSQTQKRLDDLAEAIFSKRPGPPEDEVLRLLDAGIVSSELDAIVARIKDETLKPFAVGRHGTAEVVVVGMRHYADLVDAHLAWRMSPHLMARLDPQVHRPLPGSVPVTDELWQSLGPDVAEMWEEAKRQVDSE